MKLKPRKQPNWTLLQEAVKRGKLFVKRRETTAMTKKDFIALADVIKEWQTFDRDGDDFYPSQTVIHDLADFCEMQNPNFNRQRWLDYIDGKVGPNGGKK